MGHYSGMHSRTTIRQRVILALLTVTCASAPAGAQTMQGDWPCKQVRVPDIALAGVWTGPSVDQARKSWREDPAIADFVSRIAPRRTPLEEAERLIDDFAKNAGAGRKDRLTLLFGGLYDRLTGERLEVVNGLDRFGRRLKEMAEKTREETQAFFDLQNRKPPDPEAVKKASEALQWRVRLFDEQRKMVSYVCESPALIEQRLGALARKIEADME
ncbi:hypothetical protein [Methylocystis parvus]|uniref:hypothetical protein n=1 Tax=Methylocystis parvus TaxID=134 RepID=UPI00036D27F0|nr:hypothetical protein [Methylocystis parvus]WBJ99205.1 hypothetical protein MMG94_14535 [Methylocystis parvus OBBP]